MNEIVNESTYVQEYLQDTLNNLEDVEMEVYNQGKGIE